MEPEAPDLVDDEARWLASWVRAPAGLTWWIVGTRSGTPAEHDQAIAAICGARWKVADRRLLADETRRLEHNRQASVGPTPADVTVTGNATIWLLHRIA